MANQTVFSFVKKQAKENDTQITKQKKIGSFINYQPCPSTVNVRICPPSAIFTLRGIRTKQSGAREVVPDFITYQHNKCKIITIYKYIYVT
jgi:hypothetical protein